MRGGDSPQSRRSAITFDGDAIAPHNRILLHLIWNYAAIASTRYGRVDNSLLCFAFELGLLAPAFVCRGLRIAE